MYKAEIDKCERRNKSKITVGDFKTPLSVTDVIGKQKSVWTCNI